MVSSIGGGGARMPSMDAMRQMQQKMFNKADADGSGGLGKAEFEGMMKAGPMGGKGPQGMGSEDAFKKIDGDGNGELTQAEMQTAQKQMMERFQSTMQAFGQGGQAGQGGGGGGTQSGESKYAVSMLLEAVGSQAEKSGSAQQGSSRDDVMAQLKAMIEKVSSTYATAGSGGNLNASLLSLA